MERKIFDIEDYEVKQEDGKFYMSGYANTKNKPDRYGDIPKGDNVYELKAYKKNPIVFIDHINSASKIAGTMVNLAEDKKGLPFKLLLRNIEDVHVADVKDAIAAYKTGFGRALSIGGRWSYDDEKNPTHLTKAEIFEISLVGVGADGNALTDTPKPKKYNSDGDKTNNDNQDLVVTQENIKTIKKEPLKNLISEVRKNVDNI